MIIYHINITKLVDVNNIEDFNINNYRQYNSLNWFMLSPQSEKWLKINNSTHLIHHEKDIDRKATLEKNPHLKNYSYEIGQFNCEDINDNWARYYDIEDPSITIMLNHTQIVYKDIGVVYFYSKEIGYLEDPFIQSNLELEINEDILQILNKYDREQVDNHNVEIFDKDMIESLQAFVINKEEFKEQMIERWNKMSFIIVSW